MSRWQLPCGPRFSLTARTGPSGHLVALNDREETHAQTQARQKATAELLRIGEQMVPARFDSRNLSPQQGPCTFPERAR